MPIIGSQASQINVQSIGVGLTTFAAGSGVTVTSNVFTVIGDLS